MTALARAPAETTMADPIKVLEARAQARAYLWAHCEILDLIEAVDPLQDYAVRSGLVDTIGQDAVQAILAAAFQEYAAWAR